MRSSPKFFHRTRGELRRLRRQNHLLRLAGPEPVRDSEPAEPDFLQRAIVGSVYEHAVIVTGLDHYVIYYNHQAASYFGRPLEQAVGRRIQELLSDRDSARLSSAFDEIPAEGTRELDVEVRDTEGLCRDLKLSVGDLQEDGDRSVGYLLIGKDVTQEKQAAAERERLLLDYGIRLRELNLIFDVTQIVEEETTLEGILERIAWKLPVAFLRPLHTSVRIRCGERTFSSPGFQAGRVIHDVEISSGGQPAGAIEMHSLAREYDSEGVFHREERALLRHVASQIGKALHQMKAQEALKESEDRYRTLIEHQVEGVVIVDPELQLAYANRAAEKILGTDEGELRGRSIWDFLDRRNRALLLRETRSLIDRTCSSLQLHVRREDGAELELQVTLYPLFGPSGELLSAAGVFQDITTVKRTEQRLDQRLRAERALSSVSAAISTCRDPELALERAIGEVGLLARASRACFYRLDEAGAGFDLEHEWCDTGVNSRKDRLSRLPLADLSQEVEQLGAGAEVVIRDTHAATTSAGGAPGPLRESGIHSQVLLPVTSGDALAGFLGLDNLGDPAQGLEVELPLLRVAARLFGEALDRRPAEG